MLFCFCHSGAKFLAWAACVEAFPQADDIVDRENCRRG